MNALFKTHIEIVDSSPNALFAEIIKQGIEIFNIEQIDELTYRAYVKHSKVANLMQIVSQNDGLCKIICAPPVSKLVEKFKENITIIAGISLLLFASVFLPTRVLAVHVAGNNIVPTKLIIEKAYQCGIRFGVDRRTIRSEHIKNQLISQLPEIEWVGINTDGCIATICVSEKTDIMENTNTGSIISNIVASRDGIILEKTITKGTPVCDVGQAVHKGQLLVSGYSDCGLYLRATQAEAEILAQTNHEICAFTPASFNTRVHLKESEKRYSLLIGKKLIKLYKDSGISDSTCVKIYRQDHLLLPGSFLLPVSLITEQIDRYETKVVGVTNCSWIEKYVSDYLCDHMIAGQILESNTQITESKSVIQLHGTYNCSEIIGKTKVEVLLSAHGDGN